MLPEKFFPGVADKDVNQTNEIKILAAHIAEKGINQNVLGYITNPSNKIHVPPTIRKLLSIDAELVSSELQEKTCTYLLKSTNDVRPCRFITVDNFMKKIGGVSSELTNMLNDNLMFDTIELSDLIHIPTYGYRYGQSDRPWYATSGNLEYCPNVGAIITREDATLIDYKSMMHFSNNRPLGQDEFTKFTRLISNESTELLAIDIMNVINPETSFIPLILAYNYIPHDVKRKCKAKLLLLMRELYGFRIDIENYNLNSIIDLYTRHFQEPTQEQLEFLADNYYNDYTERSSVFDFKLKIKTK